MRGEEVSKLPCANSFEPLIQVESFSDGTCRGVQTIMDLAESGKAGRFVHYILEGFPQWQTLCALEDALIDNGVHKGWTFVVGRIADLPEVRGWMECEGWAIVPLGPVGKQSGSDVLAWNIVDFTTDVDSTEWARTTAAPESGIVLNRMLKEQFRIDESLGGPE
jgi:hypothetical protein